MGQVICFPSLKGGVGKSTLVILLANYFAAAGYVILVIDLDINNSLTFYYRLGEYALNTQNKNIAKALYDDGKIDDNIVQTHKKNISIIPSSLNLTDLRAMDTRRLQKKLAESERLKEFDFILLDNAPTYDNIVISSIRASDYIITPVNFDQFNINTTKFLEYKILDEIPEKMESWYLLYNGYNEQSAVYENSIQSQLMAVYQESFHNVLDVKFPRSAAARRHIDTNQIISKKNKDTFKLWQAVDALAHTITNNPSMFAEAF